MTKALSFASSREWCDNEHRIAFSADASGRNVLFFVGFTTLERFGTVNSPQDALGCLAETGPPFKESRRSNTGSGRWFWILPHSTATAVEWHVD